MKKLLLLSSLALVFATSACRKERTCECKTTATEVRTGFGEQTTVDTWTDKTTKAKQMKGAFKYSTHCFAETYSYNSSGGNGVSAWSSVTTVVSTCDLK
ncbi:MAG: hypothetical protein IT236_15325 [Bacteroidia bacterium]|nr:hypothetical protein [Bacteroidia bacterium]